MAATALRSQGVKGSDVYASTGDPRVDLSVMLVRGLDASIIIDGLNKVLALGTQEAVEDAALLAFQTRNIRGGKGERDLSKAMFLHLWKSKYGLMSHLLPLIPKYGCWRDLFVLADAAKDKLKQPVENAVIVRTVDQLTQDADTPEGTAISLCAKWAPREGDPLAKELAQTLFPSITKFSSRMKAYRKLVAGLNRRIKTTEIKMCDRTWADILPATVPGRCLKKCKKAFLNEPLPKRGRGGHGGRASHDSALRYPGNEDRMECREHFTTFFAKAASGELKVKGADTVYPHEVIKDVLNILAHGTAYRRDRCYCDESDESDDTCDCCPRRVDATNASAATSASQGERNLLIGQWRALVEKAKAAGALKNSIAMCDFSGSMDGQPKLICTALGMLVAEVNGTNKILTFDDVPTWITFPEGDVFTRAEAVRQSALGQGLSTDFQKAMDLILADIKARRVRPEDMPKDLIVFTDMGWDQACGSCQNSYYTGNSYRHNVKTAPWQTHLEMIRESFRRAGEDMWGVSFVPPRIVVWNLQAINKDYHATSDQEGVVMLSGWSPSLFKVLQEGGVAVATPYEALRAQLDDPMYDAVRTAVRAWYASSDSRL